MLSSPHWHDPKFNASIDFPGGESHGGWKLIEREGSSVKLRVIPKDETILAEELQTEWDEICNLVLYQQSKAAVKSLVELMPQALL